MWSYAVRGHHPKYTAPIVDKARVSTRLSKEVTNKLLLSKTKAKKNFVKNNISATKGKANNF